MPLVLPCRNRWCTGYQPCPAHPIVAFAGVAGAPMPPGWAATRAAQLAAFPSCHDCGAPATEVHHLIPRWRGGSDDPVNLRSLCDWCHSRKDWR
jgi:5-methylcytosine-specific restriction endonuclease McrA